MDRRLRIANIIVTVILIIGFILLGAFVFQKSYIRIYESLSSLFESVKYYFCTIIGKPIEMPPHLNDVSGTLEWDGYLPTTPSDFGSQAEAFFKLFIDRDNFVSWGTGFAHTLGEIAKWLIVLLPAIVVFFVALKMVYMARNTRHGKDTIPLKIFKAVARVVYTPVRNFVRQYIAFVRRHKWLVYVAAFIWACNLNITTILLSALAFYFYFAVSFDVVNLFKQFGKLIVDLQVVFKPVFIPAWVIAILYALDRFRKKIAYNELRHMERKNKGFINELPIVTMICGSMGKKKTTLLTDMTLSQAVMFRDVSLERLRKADMKFPHFKWILFEVDIREAMKAHIIYNLVTAKDWVQAKERQFEQTGDISELYGYDIARYGVTFNDKLKVECLFDVLTTYAQLYFIYVIESSIIVSNYSIREDSVFSDLGNFPLWFGDFFPKRSRMGGKHSHVLDFDALRLGKKMVEDNPNIGSFEFGVVAITEIGKERGNNLELKEVKKGTDEANQKNDLFNFWLKMCRHSATVDNCPFIKVFTDEQRPESWGADARDLADILHIVSSGEMRLALPFYTLENDLAKWMYEKFMRLYTEMRYRRGDNTLLVHILKTITAALFKYDLGIWNRFGYSVCEIEKERGTQDGDVENKKYYLMNFKIYNRRFATDCFADYFNELARNSNVGIADYLEYMTERASVDELKAQHSYFIDSMYK